MKPLFRLVAVVSVTMASVWILTGCRTMRSASNLTNRPHYPKSFTIVRHPESRTAQANSFVVFAVRVHPEHHAKYQWFFNGGPIKDAISREYFVRQASVANAGTYSVEVEWPAGKVRSHEAFLSVYKVREANGIAGTMVVPIKAFKPASRFDCDAEPGVKIDKEYTPGDTEELPFCFYGPDVPLGDQTGPFLNWGHLPNLRINASTGAGGARPTAILFSDNSNLRNPKALACDSDNGPEHPRIVRTNLATNLDPKKARYGVTIYKGGPTSKDATVEFSWLYY